MLSRQKLEDLEFFFFVFAFLSVRHLILNLQRVMRKDNFYCFELAFVFTAIGGFVSLYMINHRKGYHNKLD